MARTRSGLDGIRDLERSFDRLGKVPQTVATKSARAGGSIALKAAKRGAPVDEGNLKRGIIMKRERTKEKGKAVYDILIDPAMNSVFVKVSKDGKRSYYPASQEYGFLTVDGGYVPGYRYLRNAADDNRRQIESRVLEVTGKEIDKALRKG